MTSQLTIGLSLSLSGKYSAMGRQAEAALRLFTNDVNVAGGVTVGDRRYQLVLECHDDESRRDRTAEIYRELCSGGRAQLIFGPYSTALTRVAAKIAEDAGMVLVNHGGAGDDLYENRLRMIVGVLSPAGDYMTGFVRLLSTLKLWRKRVALIAPRGSFARAVANGVERSCADFRVRYRGVRLRVKYYAAFDPERTPRVLLPALRRNRINAVVSAGSYEHDVATMRLVIDSRLNVPVLACVAAGVNRFGIELGDDAEGIVGPSQWEEQADTNPLLGPTSAEFARHFRAESGAECDYPAAQAYAAGLLTFAALGSAQSLDQNRLRAAFSDLRASTFFGDFAIDPQTGRQVGHKMLLVQWHRGHKVIIHPEAHTEVGELELPSGWRLITAGFQYLRLKHRDSEPETYDESGGDDDESG